MAAVYRYVHSSFWEDTKVLDDMTPEDRYFMLYLLTNPHTNQLGCYEIGIKQMVNETGYNSDTIDKLLNRFENILKIIKYSKENKELLIINWYKYNWTKSPKVQTFIMKQLEKIKTDEFLHFFNTIAIPYIYGIDKRNKKKINIKENKNKINIFEIIEKEFGRTIAPLEYEVINTWFDDYNDEIILKAIQEASLYNKKSIKYIDRILQNWKNNSLKTIQEVDEYNKNFLKNKSQNHKNEDDPYGTYLN